MPCRKLKQVLRGESISNDAAGARLLPATTPAPMPGQGKHCGNGEARFPFRKRAVRRDSSRRITGCRTCHPGAGEPVVRTCRSRPRPRRQTQGPLRRLLQGPLQGPLRRTSPGPWLPQGNPAKFPFPRPGVSGFVSIRAGASPSVGVASRSGVSSGCVSEVS